MAPFQKGQSGNPKGRPRRSEKFAGQIAAAEQTIADRLPEILENLFELARGVTIQEPTDAGGVRIYTRAPDYRANEYLMNRIMGKPTERQEITGEDGGPIEVTDARDRLAGLLARRAGGADAGGDPGTG